MKKMLCMLIAVSLMFAAVTAFAASSKTVTNTTRVESVVVVEEAEPAAEPVVEIAENEEEVAQEIASLQAFVSEAQKSLIEYFPEETQTQVAAMLPEGTDAAALECNEFVTVTQQGYEDAAGDVVVNFSFATTYKPEQKVVVLMGFYTGEVDAEGNNIVEWVPVEAVAQADGSLDVKLTQDVLAKFEGAKTVAMAVLSEKQ